MAIEVKKTVRASHQIENINRDVEIIYKKTTTTKWE